MLVQKGDTSRQRMSNRVPSFWSALIHQCILFHTYLLRTFHWTCWLWPGLWVQAVAFLFHNLADLIQWGVTHKRLLAWEKRGNVFLIIVNKMCTWQKHKPATDFFMRKDVWYSLWDNIYFTSRKDNLQMSLHQDLRALLMMTWQCYEPGCQYIDESISPSLYSLSRQMC